jgi:hypothetical protein
MLSARVACTWRRLPAGSLRDDDLLGCKNDRVSSTEHGGKLFCTSSVTPS